VDGLVILLEDFESFIAGFRQAHDGYAWSGRGGENLVRLSESVDEGVAFLRFN
jgi:hypothetical protein